MQVLPGASRLYTEASEARTALLAWEAMRAVEGRQKEEKGAVDNGLVHQSEAIHYSEAISQSGNKQTNKYEQTNKPTNEGRNQGTNERMNERVKDKYMTE